MPAPNKVDKLCEIRPLPGALDDVLMFNSNSPEVVTKEGILVSTFPPEGKQVPTAHLNLLLEGQFNLFAHHINKNEGEGEPKTLFIAALIGNPGKKKVKLKILDAASYLSQPDAPFIILKEVEENPAGKIYAGPGDRVTDDLLRGSQQDGWPKSVTVAPGDATLLFNLPIPVRPLKPALNGRSTLIRLTSNGPVHIATLALFSRRGENGEERPPSLEEWQTLLNTSELAGPRDKVPTPPDASGAFIYGRVAGVQRGSTWKATIRDNAASKPKLHIPQPGHAFAYPISTVDHGTFGTLQIQSAPLVVRYPDTAYQAHGNYGVEYNLTLPLYNDTESQQTVSVSFETPIKTNKKEDCLSFFEPPPTNVFFRGTVEFQYRDDNGQAQDRYVHLVERRGQICEPQIVLSMKPKSRRQVKVRLLYPPDATPPQVLTVATRAVTP